jgi:hypothetical protein
VAPLFLNRKFSKLKKYGKISRAEPYLKRNSKIKNQIQGANFMENMGVKLAQKQLDAYNAQNLEEFLSVYSEDVQIMEFPSNRVTANGLEEMRERYRKLFKDNPNNHAELLARIVKENHVIDHEYVTGRANGKEAKAVAIYEIQGEKIAKVWFL